MSFSDCHPVPKNTGNFTSLFPYQSRVGLTHKQKQLLKSKSKQNQKQKKIQYIYKSNITCAFPLVLELIQTRPHITQKQV
jgi:hypothetical protein